jgi:hypothetical protein
VNSTRFKLVIERRLVSTGGCRGHMLHDEGSLPLWCLLIALDVLVLRGDPKLTWYMLKRLLSIATKVPRVNCVYSTSCRLEYNMGPSGIVFPHAATVRSIAPIASSVRHSTRMHASSHPFEASPLHCDMLDALHAVRVASQACMRVQRSLQQESINTKTDDSPVTIADYAAQAIIAWILQRSCDARYKL